MTFHKRYRLLAERMHERGIYVTGDGGYLLDDLNTVMLPLGFRVIEEDEVIEATLQDIEQFLERLDEQTHNKQDRAV